MVEWIGWHSNNETNYNWNLGKRNCHIALWHYECLKSEWWTSFPNGTSPGWCVKHPECCFTFTPLKQIFLILKLLPRSPPNYGRTPGRLIPRTHYRVQCTSTLTGTETRIRLLPQENGWTVELRVSHWSGQRRRNQPRVEKTSRSRHSPDL